MEFGELSSLLRSMSLVDQAPWGARLRRSTQFLDEVAPLLCNDQVYCTGTSPVCSHGSDELGVQLQAQSNLVYLVTSVCVSLSQGFVLATSSSHNTFCKLQVRTCGAPSTNDTTLLISGTGSLLGDGKADTMF